MLELTLKVFIGTMLYVAILWVARLNPRAAGMMLTFPALNGVALLLTAPINLKNVVTTMLMLPVINGLFCGVFLIVISHFNKEGLRLISSAKITWLVICIFWMILVLILIQAETSVATYFQLPFLVVTIICGLILTLLSSASTLNTKIVVQNVSLMSFSYQNWRRIILFSMILFIFMIADKFNSSPVFIGVVGALPLIPFFSLYTISTDNDLLPNARRAELLKMTDGVWLGPSIAICFILLFWRWLEFLSTRLEDVHYWFASTFSLLVGWGLCFFTIWCFQYLLHRILHRQDLI